MSCFLFNWGLEYSFTDVSLVVMQYFFHSGLHVERSEVEE